MPHKYALSNGWHVPKQKHKIGNWSAYNQSLKNRGRIDIWLSQDAISSWSEENQTNVGEGRPQY